MQPSGRGISDGDAMEMEIASSSNSGAPAAAAVASGAAVASSNSAEFGAYPASKLKLDQFFLQFLSENQDLVTALLEDVAKGRPIRPPASAASTSTPSSPSMLAPSTSHALFATTPPLSPTSKARSPLSPFSPRTTFRSTPPGAPVSPRSWTDSAPLSQIPPFYFPAPSRAARDVRAAEEKFSLRMGTCYAVYPAEGMPQQAFVELVHLEMGLPKMVAHALFQRLASPQAVPASVSLKALVDFWLPRHMVGAHPAHQVYQCLRQDGKEYLVHDDFRPLVECVLQYHPGLEFLKDTAEFQKKYLETVIYRIFYTLNRSGNGRITLPELRRSDLVEALEQLDANEDINKVLKYFSYEHFYVIYCKFWELDTNRDFLIDRSDLLHYSQGALSYHVIDRIFEQVPRRFTCTEPDKMSYEDFVWLILSEEDKTTDTAIEYWFRCADLDSDGVIRPWEMWFFYEEQLKRMEGLPSVETVLFEDVVCQLHDMLQPAVEGAYTLSDLKRTKPRSAVLFNALFNLHKFLRFENRDPFAARAEATEFAGLSEWDKFASIEYCRLANEDEQEDVNMQQSGW